jgi:Domain of unknown function (DUF1902)
MSGTVTVKAVWDDEASVWVATSEDVPGLAIESPTLDRLVERLKSVIPELLNANGYPDGDELPFTVIGELTAVTYRAAA